MAPRSVARGVPRSGDRAAEGMPGRAKIYILAPTARYGVASSSGRYCFALRGLPDFNATRMGRGFAGGQSCQAPREGDWPFASSPFAHPIPQSRRRASGDLFSASLGKR